ncbi:MAG TPA: polysaccharide biosynthesis/export family protein [Acidobacteriaceae bacterium]|nr:polysaccharide biosynthesis/export family protein [Acidobacteriaceae bacterium]
MSHRQKIRIDLAVAVTVCSLALFAGSAEAQFAGPAVTTLSPPAGSSTAALTAKYGDVRIMPGDIISIATYGAPELSTTATTTVNIPGSSSTSPVQGIKVGAQGEIVLPYLGVVKIGGMTPAEASEFLARGLKDAGILVNPQVTVELVDSPTRVITVMGEVQKPSTVPAFGELRLLDVISACGGFTPTASHTITVRRRGQDQPITVLIGTDPRNTDESNIPLMAGDTVIVPKVGNVFVVGMVRNPEAIPLASNTPITVLRAISMSGGLTFGSAMSKTMIIRTLPNGQRVEISLDLKKIMNGKQKDVALASDDVLLVPTNGFKAGLAGGGAAVAASSLYGIGYVAKAP